MDFEKFSEDVRNGVEENASRFTEADDDFIPIIHMDSGDGQSFVFGLDGGFFASDESKDMLVNSIIMPAISGTGAKRMATIFSSWMVKYDAGEVPEGADFDQLPRPSEHPDRIEVVFVTTMDAHNQRAHLAEIKRHEGKPPTLGKWDEQDGGSLTGRFVEGIQDALRDSDGKPREDFMERLKAAGDSPKED